LNIERNNFMLYSNTLKKLLLVFIFLLLNPLLCEEKYKFEFNGSFKEKTKLLGDDSTFSYINTFGAFSDNQGNIGKYECDGIREASNIGKLINLNVLCEIIDKDLDKMWLKAKRETDREGGIGEYFIIDATGKFTNKIGTKCTYAVTFFNEIIFIKAVCK